MKAGNFIAAEFSMKPQTAGRACSPALDGKVGGQPGLCGVHCALASIWGSKAYDPALVGILFKAEIAVGDITVALWAGEPFGLREIVGVLLISGAALADSIWDFWQARRACMAACEQAAGTIH